MDSSFGTRPYRRTDNLSAATSCGARIVDSSEMSSACGRGLNHLLKGSIIRKSWELYQGVVRNAQNQGMRNCRLKTSFQKVLLSPLRGSVISLQFSDEEKQEEFKEYAISLEGIARILKGSGFRNRGRAGECSLHRVRKEECEMLQTICILNHDGITRKSMAARFPGWAAIYFPLAPRCSRSLSTLQITCP